jgi:hypothetical protein
MKKSCTTFLLAVLLISLFSCNKKSETIIATSIIYPSYSGLKTGNYWIYQQFDIDGLGNATAKNVFDSCYVEKDTLIKDHTYYKILKPKPYTSPTVYEATYLRDSLHFIINSKGSIKFSSKEFASTFSEGYQILAPNDTLIKFSLQMDDKMTTVNTTAGIFPTLDCKYTYTYSANPKNGSYTGKTIYIHSRFAESIGLVIETLPFIQYSSSNIERRLVRYHLN